LIDTGALVGEEDISLHESVREQTRVAMMQSDVVIVVFDGMHGLHPLDHDVVAQARELTCPVIFVANKCEKPASALTATELYGLGLEEVIPVSAAHRRGIRDVMKRVFELLPQSDIGNLDDVPELDENGDFEPYAQPAAAEDGGEGVEDLEALAELEAKAEETITLRRINIAILGKPNAGKSTFVNKLLGEDRMITSPIAGTTRDSIKSDLSRDGRDFEIVDTAGLRKKAGVRDDTIERYSNLRTLRSLAQCDVAVFLLDASEGAPTEQDARIVGLAHEKGKALVIIVNKWDLIEKDAQTAEAFRIAVRSVFKFAAYAPVIFVSALTGQRCFAVLDTVAEVFDAGRKRISTAEVNKIFSDAFAYRPPPVYRGQPVKLLYATQVTTRPPTFAVFVNYPERLAFNFERYLKNSMRKVYAFPGNDIRILFRRRSKLTNDRKRAA
jgi:GTP-binding protein